MGLLYVLAEPGDSEEHRCSPGPACRLEGPGCQLEGPGCWPEGPGCRPEGRGCWPEGPGCWPEGQGLPAGGTGVPPPRATSGRKAATGSQQPMRSSAFSPPSHSFCARPTSSKLLTTPASFFCSSPFSKKCGIITICKTAKQATCLCISLRGCSSIKSFSWCFNFHPF